MGAEKPARWRRIVGWIGLVVGVGMAVFLGIAAFFASVGLPMGLYPALILGALVFCGVMWLSGRVTTPWLDLKLLVMLIACSSVILGSVFWTLFFRPMGFPYTAFPELESAGYWDLPTGSRIAYVRHPPSTDGASPLPVVFLHGGPGLPELPDEEVVAAVNGAGFEAIGYHQFGAGLSSRAKRPSREYTVARQVADLEAIREHLGADRLILVGQSWGGMLAANYTAAFPDRVESLVLTAPAPAWLPAFGIEALRSVHRLSEEEQLALHDLVAPHVSRLAFRQRLQELNPDAADQLIGEREYAAFAQAQSRITSVTLACDPRAAEDLFFPGQGGLVNRYTFADMEALEDPRPKLRGLDLPVLILRPECDYVAPEVTEDYAQIFNGAELNLVPGAGHEIQLEQKDAYMTHLLRHLLAGSEEAEPDAIHDVSETGEGP